MKIQNLLEKISLKNKNLHYKLNLLILYFLLPVIGFIGFAIKYNLLDDIYIPIFIGCVLAFSFLGFIMLRKLFDAITNISINVLRQVEKEFPKEQFQIGRNELHNISHSFDTISNQYRNTLSQLDKKASSISVLKEFSDICYVTFDPEEVLHIALERTLTLTNSDLGSIMIIDKPDRKSFTVKANIGGEAFVKKGDQIDFETSIAKYAVINKSPIVVNDIEKDTRFGRKNRSRYGTKAFICMPIKTRNNIVGVLTISSTKDNKQYTHENVEILTPLLSNAAFMYENLHLLKEKHHKAIYLKVIENIWKILNSSCRDSELFDAILSEIQKVVPFDLAIVLTTDEYKPDNISIVGLISRKPVNISNGSHYHFKGSIIDTALKQENILMCNDTKILTHEVEKELFVNQGYKSCLLIPINLNGAAKGILALSAQKTGMLHQARDLFRWIPNVLSLAIERSHLAAAVVKRNQELQTIRQIGSALASSTFDIKQVLNYTMDMIRVLMNVTAGSLYLVEEEGLEFAAAFNVEAASQKKLRLKFGQGIAGRVAARGESIIVNDIQTSPNFFPETNDSLDFKTKSALCVPMISQGKVIGVIEVLNKINGDFTVNDEELLQSIGASVSIAIENAELYRETISMAEEERGMRNMFQKFVPKEILDQIIHGSNNGDNMIEELKILTLINIDIRGFSVLSRRLGPQKTVALLNHFFSVMGNIVFKHHGIVDKYLGDGFLAIFGAPVSNIKDADNAIAAALEMQESVSSLNDYFTREFGASVMIGISVHTGKVVAGNIGFDMKMDYTVIGDSVNDVFRLQELTKQIANGILISENTYQAAQSRLELIEIDPASYSETDLCDTQIYELIGFTNDHLYMAQSNPN